MYLFMVPSWILARAMIWIFVSMFILGSKREELRFLGRGMGGLEGAVGDVVGGHEFLDAVAEKNTEARDVDFFWEFGGELPKMGVDFGYLVDLIVLRRNQDFEVGKRGGEFVILLAGEKLDIHPIQVNGAVVCAGEKDDNYDHPAGGFGRRSWGRTFLRFLSVVGKGRGALVFEGMRG